MTVETESGLCRIESINHLPCRVVKYKAMKEAEKKGVTKVVLSEQTLQYLYICVEWQRASADMNRYFISKLSAQATDLTVYGKALSAIVLQQAGETVKAKEFVQSVGVFGGDRQDGAYAILILLGTLFLVWL